MNRATVPLVVLAAGGLTLAFGCARPEQTQASAGAATQAAAPRAAASPHGGGAPGAMTSGADGTVRGKVLETLDTAGYTYVRIQPEGGAELWAAAPQVAVKVGDEVLVSTSMPMANYESATLNRTFDVVYFSGAIQVVGADGAPTEGAPAEGARQEALAQAHASVGGGGQAQVEVGTITKAADGHAVAEVHEKSAALAGKPVVVRGRVVKFTPAVMKRNWLHLRDGSGEGPTSDLTVTTQDEAAVGDVVVVRGTVVVNQDFGSGYSYAVLVQDATLQVEAAP